MQRPGLASDEPIARCGSMMSHFLCARVEGRDYIAPIIRQIGHDPSKATPIQNTVFLSELLGLIDPAVVRDRGMIPCGTKGREGPRDESNFPRADNPLFLRLSQVEVSTTLLRRRGSGLSRSTWFPVSCSPPRLSRQGLTCGSFTPTAYSLPLSPCLLYLLVRDFSIGDPPPLIKDTRVPIPPFRSSFPLPLLRS